MEYIILFGLLAILLAIGVPVAFSLLAATLATVLYLALPPIVVFQQMGSDITSVALLAIPLFIFTGELMMKGGRCEAAALFLGLCVVRDARLRLAPHHD